MSQNFGEDLVMCSNANRNEEEVRVRSRQPVVRKRTRRRNSGLPLMLTCGAVGILSRAIHERCPFIHQPILYAKGIYGPWHRVA